MNEIQILIVAITIHKRLDFGMERVLSVDDFAAEVEEVYCKCLQHKLQAAQLLQVAAWKGKGLYGGQQRSINHRLLR